METCINYTDLKVAFISSDELKWINRIHKLKEERPDEVVIIREPEHNDGCIYAKIPPQWVKVIPKRIYSEEQIEKFREQMNRVRDLSQAQPRPGEFEHD